MFKKLFAIILISWAVCLGMFQPVFSQESSIYVIDDFSKMLQSHISSYLIPQNAASEARNVRANTQYGSLSKRPATMLYGSLGSSAVTSLHRFYKSDGTAYLLGTLSTLIVLGDDDGGAAVTLRDQLTTDLRWTWVTYKDKAIGCNGTDRCQKYDGKTTTTANTDGARTASILTADLGAPFSELNTGSNLDASSWYQYKVQFTDGTTTWYSSAVSNPILTGSTVRDISLSDIPLGPAGTTSRTLYRTAGEASRSALSSATFYTLATISDNTTITYNDAIADGSLGAAWSTSGKTDLTPPIVKYITIHKERLFGANAPNLNSYIYWSYPFKPDIFATGSDYDFVRIDDGDVITFVIEIAGKLAIGKTNSITNFETQNSDDTKWQFYTFSFVGCPAPYSAVSSPLGIIYLGWNGLYVYNGENSQNISDAVTDVVRDILVSNFNDVSGVYFNHEYRLAYTSEQGGGSINDSVLLFDTIRNAYVLDDMEVNSWTVFASGNDFGTLYSGSSDTDGNVLSHNPALSTFIVRYKSELEEGTKDSITISGTENAPEMRLGWGITINDSSLAGITINSASATATIDRDDTTGYWWSPALQVNASDYDKLYWNEDLGCCGNVTFAMRSAATSAALVDPLAWSSEVTNPSGSDVSGNAANTYMQLRAKLTTTDITETPVVESLNNFVIKLVYSKVGASNETSINSIWRGGFHDFGVPDKLKKINGINVYYAGTSGTMTVGLINERGDINQSFSFDLSVDPDTSSTDRYFGTDDYKVYKWLPPVNSVLTPTPIGRKWQFSVTENGAVIWDVSRIDVQYNVEEDYAD